MKGLQGGRSPLQYMLTSQSLESANVAYKKHVNTATNPSSYLLPALMKTIKKKKRPDRVAAILTEANMIQNPGMLTFLLPRIKPDWSECCWIKDDPITNLDHVSLHHDFSLQRLAWALQHGAGRKSVERYLQSFSASRIATELGTELEIVVGGPCFPILYFAVECNSPDIVRILCDAGALPNQRMRQLCMSITEVPLLAYAVFSAEYNLSNTDETVITLLAMGANPSDVPKDMWEDYLKAPTEDNPNHSVTEKAEGLWCSPELRAALCRNLNLAQRHFLWIAERNVQPNTRMRQFARADKINRLFELPYHVIGHQPAIRSIIDYICTHVHLKVATPLMLLFTGPSGHGKTELANTVGKLLSLNTLRVDCTKIVHNSDQLSSKGALRRAETSAPLDKYIVELAGQRAVIFLDNLDRTTDAVRGTLLSHFKDGSYKDRRNDEALDCSHIIWILASNIGAEAINRFWNKHLKDLNQDQQKEAPYCELQPTLQHSVTTAFGAPLTGRLSMLVPLLPFNEGEQAVVAYKFMREMWIERKRPISIEANEFVRHIYLSFVHDGQIAMHLARKGYSIGTGAGLLNNTVSWEIGKRLMEQFSGEDSEGVDKMNDYQLPNYEVRVVTVDDGSEKLQVKRLGSKQSLSKPGAIAE